MKKLSTIFFAWLLGLSAIANDGVYYTSGNQLVPIRETDIAITKEVLTISLCDDEFARVDVQYEFFNRGPAKTVQMGFEAAKPYNSGDEFNPKGVHPHIFDFTVVMNGERLPYRNAVVALDSLGETDFVPLDTKVWKAGMGEDDADEYRLYNVEDHSYTHFSYAYYFTANFKEGVNKVHHTYRYRMSMGVGRCFEVPYWLTPAMRWANHQIDDFTLRIKAENTAKHFAVTPEVFRNSSEATSGFQLVSGEWKIRLTKSEYDMEYFEIALRNGVVEWKATDFRPKDDLTIVSVDTYTSFTKGYKVGSFYDRSDSYIPTMNYEEKPDPRILRNLPYANRGYVFKDKKLQDYFSQFFWYMPNPSWQQSTADFTPREWRLINEGK